MTWVPDFEISSPKKHCSTSWNNIICGVPSKVLHFPYFSLTVANFPLLTRQTSSLYVRKNEQPCLSTEPYQPQTRPQFLATHTKSQLTSLAAEQTVWWATKKGGVIYLRILVWIYYTTMPLRAYQNIFGWYTGMANNEHLCLTSLPNK